MAASIMARSLLALDMIRSNVFSHVSLKSLSSGEQVRYKSFPASWYNVRTTMRRRKEMLEKNRVPTPRPRSVWINWNYRAELFAFGKRLMEDLPEATLMRAFTHPSYVEKEEARREELGTGLPETSLSLKDNSILVIEGEKLMMDFIQKYLHLAFPALPDDGRRKVLEHLMKEDLIAHVASHLGFADLILSTDFPPTNATLTSTFKAVVGAIKLDGSLQRAEIFVQDFIIPELIGKDILEIWELPNPVGYLRNVLHASGKELEMRLLREAGRNTIFAVYLVGVYVDKVLIGQGPGETLNTAEEMASLDALKRIFGLKEYSSPLPFGTQAERLKASFEHKKSPVVQ